ncbi:MAG: glycoside hydrolase family 127 protein [Lentisphaerae bacterium]|nr:glycoside hydrolase family 127 protein [Lentisphaerota bacterium]
MNTVIKRFEHPETGRVKFTDGVFAPRVDMCLKSTIPAAVNKAESSGRIDAFDLKNYHGLREYFYDSDTAKILEGIAYALKLYPDEKLQQTFQSWIGKIVSCQQPDGYLNSYISGAAPQDRWEKLNTLHELYCAGHLIEAAVAGKDLPGGKTLFDAVCRYADHIDSIFGLEEGKKRGWPGHEEIELALVKLYRASGNERYLKLASYFIDDRGTEPCVFPADEWNFEGMKVVRQADKPVREQDDAHGHAVRAVYLYTGMADVAAETGDVKLLEQCEKIFDNLCKKRMYITGGIGSTFYYEAFTCDYDLTNGSLMYAESCASMGLVQLASRLFDLTGKSKYLDVMETALYNGVLSGISLSGDKFFYSNYLEVDENSSFYNFGSAERQPWFSCPCCPTSFSRFLPQLGSFIYSISDDELFVNIPAANEAELLIGGQKVSLEISGGYPYDGKIIVTVKNSGRFALNLRIPSWCRSYSVRLNGEKSDSCRFDRLWEAGDKVELLLDMPVEVIRSNPKVTSNSGRIALKRGPLVYALEEIDQKYPVRELLIEEKQEFKTEKISGLPEGTLAVCGRAYHEILPSDELYFSAVPEYEETVFCAVPYALWQNRGKSSMCVWNRCK